jgi:phage anti-repressor protein
MAKDSREYGFEGEMVMSQLKGIMNHAKQLHDMLEPSTDLPEWVQSKITKAYDYVQTAADYMATEMKEETQIDELSKDTMKSYKGKAFTQYMNMTHGPTDWNKQSDKVRDKAAQRMRGINTADKKLKKEEVAVNSVGAGNVAGLQGEPPVRKKKKNVMTFNRFMKK